MTMKWKWEMAVEVIMLMEIESESSRNVNGSRLYLHTNVETTEWAARRQADRITDTGYTAIGSIHKRNGEKHE